MVYSCQETNTGAESRAWRTNFVFATSRQSQSKCLRRDARCWETRSPALCVAGTVRSGENSECLYKHCACGVYTVSGLFTSTSQEGVFGMNKKQVFLQRTKSAVCCRPIEMFLHPISSLCAFISLFVYH